MDIFHSWGVVWPDRDIYHSRKTIFKSEFNKNGDISDWKTDEPDWHQAVWWRKENWWPASSPPREHTRAFCTAALLSPVLLSSQPQVPRQAENVDWGWWIIHTAGHSGAPLAVSPIINILSTLMRFRQSCPAVAPAAQPSCRPWTDDASD